MIKNLTKNTLISENEKEAKGYVDKLIGMVVPENSEGLIIKTRFGIHTLFMTQAIDVIIVDSNKKVVGLKAKIKPFRIFVWNPKFSTIIELPHGVINKSKTQLGDKLEF